MKSPKHLPETFAATTPAQPATAPLRRLREWRGMAEGGYSANTLRAQKADGAIFQAFCEGRGQALIRRRKTDAEGQGRVAYLSRETVKWLTVWLKHAKIAEGAVFRRLIGKNQIGETLNPGSIARLGIGSWPPWHVDTRTWQAAPVKT